MLEVNHINFTYKNKPVLRNVSMQLSDGVYGLLGPNGSGKTTLLRCITGIMPLQDGTIKKPSQIGYLPQTFGMFPELTTFEVLNYFATIKGITSINRKDTIMTALKSVNLDEQATKKVGKLSGGMLRRLGIAQAIMGNPELIIFDEPTTGLDPEERLRFRNLISSICGNKTILIATHIVDDVETICDHIILLKNGTIICQEPTEKMRDCAEGYVYRVPWSEKEKLVSPYAVISNETINASKYIRVVSPHPQPGRKVVPSFEDGYMLKIKEYYAI